MVKHIVVFMLLFFGVSFTPSGKLSAHVEKTYFLKGKAGERDIAIKMLCYDEMPVRQIYYFFADDKKDRYLTGKLKDKFWSFIAEEQNRISDVKPVGALNISESTNGIWTGFWIDNLGKSWAIVLQPMIADSIPSRFNYLPFVTELDPYDRYRLSNIDFIKTKAEKLTKDLTGDWYVEKESGIFFFRLRSTNNRLKTDSINAALQTIHLSLLQKYFEYNSEKTDIKVETSFLYQTNELISFKTLSTSTFKTRNPSLIQQLNTLDIRSGQQVNLEDVIWFDKGETIPEMTDLYAIYKYRKNIFAPKVFSLLQELYPDKMQRDSCDINKVETWVLPVWSLTNKGIALGFRTFDRCDVFSWAILPYEKLEPFMEKKYHLSTKR